MGASIVARGGDGAETAEVPAPALSRMSLALVGALALHIGVMSIGKTTARAESSSVLPRSMTVRTITPVAMAPMPAAEQSPASPPTPTPETSASPSAVAAVIPVPVASRVGAPPLDTVTMTSPSASPRSPPASAEPASSSSMTAVVAAAANANPPTLPPSATAALPAAPQYLMAARLDPGPQPIGDIEPVYPESAHLQEGTVVLRVLISETGHVDNVAVARSNPKGYFEEAAIEAFSKAEFTPGRAAGVAVKSQITVEVHFLPINRGRISGRGY